jgi:hypothetical protein
MRALLSSAASITAFQTSTAISRAKIQISADTMYAKIITSTSNHENG